MSPEEHNHLIQEAQERSRASAALAAGAGALTGAPGAVAGVPPAAVMPYVVAAPAPMFTPLVVQQNPEQLLATIADLQQQLWWQSTASAGHTRGTKPISNPPAVSMTRGILPAIMVTMPMRTQVGALQTPATRSIGTMVHNLARVVQTLMVAPAQNQMAPALQTPMVAPTQAPTTTPAVLPGILHALAQAVVPAMSNAQAVLFATSPCNTGPTVHTRPATPAGSSGTSDLLASSCW